MSTDYSTTPVTVAAIDEYKDDPALDDAVKYATESCKPNLPPAGSETEAQQKGMRELMKSLNKQTCKYKKQSASAAVGGCTLWGCGAAAAAEASQSAEGCEQISILSNIVNQCTQQLSCMLNQASASTTTNVKVYQKISAEFMGNINAAVDISNMSTTNVKTLNLTQSTVQSAIGATISTGLNQAVQQAQENENEAFSDPTAQTQLNSMLNNIQNVASNSTVNQSVANTTQNMIVDQNISVKVWKDVNADFKITNENAITMIAENYVYNALDQVIKAETATVVQQEVKQESAQKQTGVDTNVVDDFAGIMGSFGQMAMIFGIIGGIILLMIAMWWGSKYFKSGKSSTAQQQAPRHRRYQKQQYDTSYTKQGLLQLKRRKRPIPQAQVVQS